MCRSAPAEGGTTGDGALGGSGHPPEKRCRAIACHRSPIHGLHLRGESVGVRRQREERPATALWGGADIPPKSGVALSLATAVRYNGCAWAGRASYYILGTLPPLVGRGWLARAITWMGNWGIRGVKQRGGGLSVREWRMVNGVLDFGSRRIFARSLDCGLLRSMARREQLTIVDL
jgi:hypothetical protein